MRERLQNENKYSTSPVKDQSIEIQSKLGEFQFGNVYNITSMKQQNCLIKKKSCRDFDVVSFLAKFCS
jgi:hypothetical protein